MSDGQPAPETTAAVTRDEVVNDRKTIPIHVRRLKFLTDDKTLPDSHLWGFIEGVLN